MRWERYHTIDDCRGNIYFIKGNQRIQITTDRFIYFYIIDRQTLKPTLENVMYNFRQCSQLMFGSKVRYGISYKTNQPGIQIYKRKFYHNFRVQIDSHNFEGAMGSNLSSIGAYILAEKKAIGLYD